MLKNDSDLQELNKHFPKNLGIPLLAFLKIVVVTEDIWSALFKSEFLCLEGTNAPQ